MRHVKHTRHPPQNRSPIIPSVHERPRGDPSSTNTFGDRFVRLSDQRLATRGRWVAKRYASLIAITRFCIAIKRVYARSFSRATDNAPRSTIVTRGTHCVNYTYIHRRRGGSYGALTRNSHDRSSTFFCIPFRGDSRTVPPTTREERKISRENHALLTLILSFSYRQQIRRNFPSHLDATSTRRHWPIFLLFPRIVNSHGYLVRSEWLPTGQCLEDRVCVMLNLLNRGWSTVRRG